MASVTVMSRVACWPDSGVVRVVASREPRGSGRPIGAGEGRTIAALALYERLIGEQGEGE